MSMKKYPYRTSVRKVISEFVTSREIVNFYKEKGILIYSQNKKETGRIASDYYMSQKSFIDLKKKIEIEHNYKKTSRISIPNGQVEILKTSLLELQSQPIGEDNAIISVLNNTDDTWKFEVQYTEFKPGMVELLDRTEKKVEVKITSSKESTNLDFDIQSKNDYHKVMEIIEKVNSLNNQVNIDFSEIKLQKLSTGKRIELFNRFFQYDHSPWSFEEIKKLKVKREEEKEPTDSNGIVTEDKLSGINSAILDGKNLIENSFVKETLETGFYFSMATMRFENISDARYLDLEIEFKSRPEKCETKMVGSGEFLEFGKHDITEEKYVFDEETQDQILFSFKNVLYQIYDQLLNEEIASASILIENGDITFNQ